MNRTVALTLAPPLLALTLAGCWGPPQIGTDKDTFRAVDALYTAVSLRDVKLVEQCEAKLKSLREAGKLPESASQSLDSMIAEAKGGSWVPAQERLSTFMEGQRH